LNTKLVSNAKRAQKLITKPNYIDRIIYNENLIAIHMVKTKSVINEAIYAGMSIIDNSKIHIVAFSV
jgi:hypothetical protein